MSVSPWMAFIRASTLALVGVATVTFGRPWARSVHRHLRDARVTAERGPKSDVGGRRGGWIVTASAYWPAGCARDRRRKPLAVEDLRGGSQSRPRERPLPGPVPADRDRHPGFPARGTTSSICPPVIATCSAPWASASYDAPLGLLHDVVIVTARPSSARGRRRRAHVQALEQRLQKSVPWPTWQRTRWVAHEDGRHGGLPEHRGPDAVAERLELDRLFRPHPAGVDEVELPLRHRQPPITGRPTSAVVGTF
jgi:hypothetical protein